LLNLRGHAEEDIGRRREKARGEENNEGNGSGEKKKGRKTKGRGVTFPSCKNSCGRPWTIKGSHILTDDKIHLHHANRQVILNA